MDFTDIMTDEHGSPPRSQASMSLGSDDNQTKTSGASWDTRKFREEYDAMKSRLSDPRFSSGEWNVPCHACPGRVSNRSPVPSPADYADPLLPRKSIKSQYQRVFPEGTEQRLRELIAKNEKKA